VCVVNVSIVLCTDTACSIFISNSSYTFMLAYYSYKNEDDTAFVLFEVWLTHEISFSCVVIIPVFVLQNHRVQIYSLVWIEYTPRLPSQWQARVTTQKLFQPVLRVGDKTIFTRRAKSIWLCPSVALNRSFGACPHHAKLPDNVEKITHSRVIIYVIHLYDVCANRYCQTGRHF